MANSKYTNLPTLYKGAGPGSHWHLNNARLSGFLAATTLSPSINGLLAHIMTSPQRSSYLSFTTSFAVARDYAMIGPHGLATASSPGYVYVIDLGQLPSTSTVSAIDPIFEISSNGGIAHSHDGASDLISEVAQTSPVLTSFSPSIKRGGAVSAPVASRQLQALVRAVRDAEILVNGNVPAAAVVDRDPVY